MIRLQLASVYKRTNFQYNGWLAFEKYDGIRAYWDGQGSLITRGGKLLNPPCDVLAALPRDHCFDGELWGGRGQFQATASKVSNLSGTVDWSSIRFKVFDVLSDDDVMRMAYIDRLKLLTQLTSNAGGFIEVAESIGEVKDELWVDDQMHAVTKSGGEGLILRDPGAKHIPGRSDYMVKVKLVDDAEGTVVGFSEGHGINRTRVGALMIRDKEGRVFKVGSGLGMLARVEPPPIGSIVTYSFSQRTDSGLPRHPRFVRVVSLA